MTKRCPDCYRRLSVPMDEHRYDGSCRAMEKPKLSDYRKKKAGRENQGVNSLDTMGFGD